MTFLEFIEMADPPDMGCGDQYIATPPEAYRQLVLHRTFYDYGRILMTENEITEELKDFFHAEMKKAQSLFEPFEECYIFGGMKPDKKYARKKLRCKSCGRDFYSSLCNYSFKENIIEGTCYKCKIREVNGLDYDLKRYFERGHLLSSE